MTKNDSTNISSGGKVLASGGFGCVFSPSIKCQDEKTTQKNKITKLMTTKHAIEEYNEIATIKKKLKNIKNYENYFLINDFKLCKPEKLSKNDLINYDSKCSALKKNNITKKNINDELDKLMALNMPNGGIPVDDFISNNASFENIHNLNKHLIQLLKNGIINMNKKNVYHCDIKDSNVLVDKSKDILYTRLIDWGLSTEYKPFINDEFPKTWRNRPLQFNVPFSVIIFTDDFVEQYTDYVINNGKITEKNLKPFVLSYFNFWMKKRGKGHYKTIHEIIYMLFSNDFKKHDSINDIEDLIEQKYTQKYIIDYIVDILIHFTRFRDNGTLNLREYLDNIFVNVVDIWGFLSIYVPLIELLYLNYDILTSNQLNIFNHLKYIYVKYLYSNSIILFELKELFKDLDILGDLLHSEITFKNKQNKLSSELSSISLSITKFTTTDISE
jgi:serine/threonine protein kinase